MDACVLRDKQEKLLSLLAQLERVAVAFSAGVDSTFLLSTAHDVLGERVLAVTGRAVTVPEQELQAAAAFCASLGVRHVVVDVDQTAIPHFADNPPERCYLCKKALFTAFSDTAREMGFPVLCDGSNADDTGDYRPGLRALRELDVRSPLREVGLTKQEIRALSRDAGLPTWDKPSLACLATRIPYGETITPQKLAVIDKAEQFLRGIGFGQVRVRMHGTLARIEVEPPLLPRFTQADVRDAVVRKMRELGFVYVTLDLCGFESGSLNRMLQL